MKKEYVILSCFAASIASVNATTVLIDFGADDLETAGNWNNVSEARLSGSAGLLALTGGGNLIDDAGDDSGFTFSAAQVGAGTIAIGGGAVDFTGTLPPNPTGSVFPTSALDSLFVNDDTGMIGSSDERYSITIGGLDNSITYDFTFLSAFTRGGGNGDALVSLVTGTAATTSLSAGFADNSFDQSAFLQLAGIAPAGGEIVVDFFGDQGNNGRLNTLEITVVPEPSAAALLGLGALGLVARRRRS